MKRELALHGGAPVAWTELRNRLVSSDGVPYIDRQLPRKTA
jgi:hypothetical protein